MENILHLFSIFGVRSEALSACAGEPPWTECYGVRPREKLESSQSCSPAKSIPPASARFQLRPAIASRKWTSGMELGTMQYWFVC